MRPDAERERLRQTFDQAADSYDRVRPEYPDELFDDLVALTGVTPGDHLLEVGCATGKATRPLARRGFRITCVELGAGLAAAARVNLAGFPVEVIQDVYDEIGEGVPPGVPWPSPWAGEQPDDRAEIDDTGLFEVTAIRRYDWERVYDVEEYIELLNTFSGHLSMADWKRQRLYTEIRRRLAMRPGHCVRRHWGAALQVARRRDEAGAASGPAGSG